MRAATRVERANGRSTNVLFGSYANISTRLSSARGCGSRWGKNVPQGSLFGRRMLCVYILHLTGSVRPDARRYGGTYYWHAVSSRYMHAKCTVRCEQAHVMPPGRYAVCSCDRLKMNGWSSFQLSKTHKFNPNFWIWFFYQNAGNQ